jgi:hypothetical protein
MNRWASAVVVFLSAAGVVSAQDPLARVEQETTKVTPAMVEIRPRIHQNPELSNREEKTATLVADYLRKLGLEVQTGVAKHLSPTRYRDSSSGSARSSPARRPAITIRRPSSLTTRRFRSGSKR